MTYQMILRDYVDSCWSQKGTFGVPPNTIQQAYICGTHRVWERRKRKFTYQMVRTDYVEKCGSQNKSFDVSPNIAYIVFTECGHGGGST